MAAAADAAVAALRPIGPARPAAADAQERIGSGRLRDERGSGHEARAPGYGRRAARIAPLFLSPSAFLAQMIGQTEVDRREPSRERHAEGVRAYRRMMGEDLIVLGPAGAAGLVL